MRGEAYELQTIGVRLAIDENEIGPDMAIAEIFPVSGERVIGVTAVQHGICGEQGHDFRQFAVEFLNVLAGLSGLLAFVVALKCVGEFNRPH